MDEAHTLTQVRWSGDGTLYSRVSPDYVAVCSCGWESEPTGTRQGARADHVYHQARTASNR